MASSTKGDEVFFQVASPLGARLRVMTRKVFGACAALAAAKTAEKLAINLST